MLLSTHGNIVFGDDFVDKFISPLSNGKMIDFGKQEEVPTRDLINELLEFIDDVVDELGSRAEVNYVQEILTKGTGADRQVEVYNRTKDLKAVVDYIITETHHGLDL